jgi:large conductance mechanosensitive channel
LVKSFVSDILMPPLSVIFPLNHNMEEKFALLKAGRTYDPKHPYNTVDQAQADGAVVMAYG